MNKASHYITFSKVEWITIVFIYLSIFINSLIFFKQPFEFYFGYLIYLVLLPVFIARFGLNRQLAGIFFVLLIVGFFNIAIGNDSFPLFLKVFLGVFLAYNFYDSVIKQFDFNVELLFKWYLTGAFITCIIGLIQFISFQIGFSPGYDYSYILNKWGVVPGGNFGIRVNSIFAEPTHLAGVISPAFFLSVYNLTRKSPYLQSKSRGLLIILIFLLSFSALGQMGILLTIALLMLNYGLIRYFFIIVILGVFIFSIIYNNVTDFRERYDGLIELFTEGREAFVLGKTHGSSFILYNNSVVTFENFKSNFMFGSGLGSHPIAFEKFNVLKGITTAGFANNSADANSMLLRLLSETGLFGTVIFLTIVIKCYVARNPELDSVHWLISNAILVLILLNLFRQGHYFLNGFPFFFLLYIYNYRNYQKFLSENNDKLLKIKNDK